VRYFVSLMVGAAVLATAVVSVRLHLLVAGQRYGLANLMDEHARADRALRRAHADLEALKAPRKLMERWAALQAADGESKPAATRPVPPVVPVEAASEDPADAPAVDEPAAAAPAEDPTPVEAPSEGEVR
jgi:hypothetical protein